MAEAPDLEGQVRLLQRKLERSEQSRRRLEDWRDRNITFHRKVIADLEASEARAVEASRTKSAFLANMSHEIRTPINGVSGLTELLLHTDLSTRQRELADLVLQSARQLVGLIDNLLDFSKIEAGQLTLERQRFDLRAVVEDAVWLVAERAHSKGLSIVCDVGPVPPLLGDALRLGQVFTNLVGNAVKFTDSGSVLVRVDAAVFEGVATFRAEVTDTGIGVTNAHALFQPFVQADASTTRRFGGTGLGLAIVRQIVEAMGGRVAYTSGEGGGSTFVVDLSLPVDPAAAVRPLLGFIVAIDEPDPSHGSALQRLLVDLGATLAEDGVVDAVLTASETQVAHLGPVVRMQPVGSWPKPERHSSDLGTQGFALSKPVRQRDVVEVLRQLRAGMPTPLPVGDLQPSRALRGARVLVVEDNAVNREVVCGMLAALGIRADVATNGRQGVLAVLENDYDLVLMDCQMPELDGLSATRQLRTAGATLPVVALTAGAFASDRQACLAAGMNDYLAKPFTAADLKNVLHQWVTDQSTVTTRDLGYAASASGRGSPKNAASATVTATLDLTRLDDLVRVDPSGSLLGQLIALAGVEAAGLFARLQDASATGDAQDARAAAHGLKACAAQLGGVGVAERLQAVEQRAVDGVLPRPEHLEEISALLGLFLDALRKAPAALGVAHG